MTVNLKGKKKWWWRWWCYMIVKSWKLVITTSVIRNKKYGFQVDKEVFITRPGYKTKTKTKTKELMSANLKNMEIGYEFCYSV